VAGGVAASGLQGVRPADKAYVIVNGLEKGKRPKVECPERMGLVVLVAGLILLEPGMLISEETLFRHLDDLGLLTRADRHPSLGDLPTALSRDLVLRGYFTRDVLTPAAAATTQSAAATLAATQETQGGGSEGAGGVSAVYGLGARLRAEVGDEELVRAVEVMMGLEGGIEATGRADLLFALENSRDVEEDLLKVADETEQ